MSSNYVEMATRRGTPAAASISFFCCEVEPASIASHVENIPLACTNET